MASKAVQEIIEDEGKLELTPMIDMAFLIIIFFMCLPFKTLDGKLQAFLPTDKGIQPIEQDPTTEIMVSVHIVARSEKPDEFGPPKYRQRITRPTEFRYKFGDRGETKDLKQVERWIAEAKKAAEGTENAKVKGEIKAGHKVPHKYVVAVLNKFSEAGLKQVDFYGTQIPTEKLKRKPYLPYPTSNYGRTE